MGVLRGCKLVSYYPDKVADAEHQNLALAIIPDIRDMQPLNVDVRISPNKALHEVVSHKLQEVPDKLNLINNQKEDADGTAIDLKQQQMCVEAGVSPKSQSKGFRKGRKQNTEVPQIVRSMKSPQGFYRVQMLNKHYKFFLIALMEPFQHQRQIQQYRRKLGMPYANSNCNGKIWFFVQHNVDVEVLLDTEQSITVKLNFQDLNKDMVVTMVYAKCSEVERLQLWDSLYLLTSSMASPWMMGGDFIVIMNEEEKIGGLPVLPHKYEDFAFCLNSCELYEIPFKGSPFTWWNGRAANDCIFKRLDRIVHNDMFQNWFGHLEVEHLSRTGSDHAPLLETTLSDDVFLSFKLKMKKLKTALSTWSKATFGDIFKQLVIREEIVKIKEQLFEADPSEENRMVMQRAQAELKLLVKGRRKRIHIRRIKDDAGNWLEDVDSVAAQAVNFFQKQFTHEEVREDSPIFNHIPELIREEDNLILAEHPTMKEVHMAVFELHGDSACGPDGFFGIFYQKCWEVIKFDVYKIVKDFFEGHTLPKLVTHTNLVFLPKKTVVQAFADMRPISLSNIINKVISRVVHDIHDKLISRVISPNQSSFVKGMNIIENLLLTQEIAHGFFHSTRGVKQGDPLSPALFIIAAEVLSRALNSLFDQPGFEYEKVSRQLINKGKSSFYMFSKVSHELSQQVATATGFVRGHFPFTYLGVPITHARKRKVDYTALLKNVKDRLQIWKGKLLSYGGKVVLITSVLQSIPIHVLSAIRPPKCVLKELHRIFAKFFWNNKEEGRCRHWEAWLNMCIPKNEGGLGFRSIYDTSKALCAKLWWMFRTTSSLWANFMWNKYCKKQIPQVVQWKGGSQVWKMMLEARDDIEQEICYVVPQSWQINEQAEDVSELMTDGRWNISKLMQLFPEDIVQHIIQEIDIKYASNEWDRPWWMMTSSGKFTMETMNHLFLCGDLATKVWRYFNMGAGLNMNCIQVKHAIRSWWEAKCHFKMKSIFKAVPAFVIWQIWKWRNNRLDGGTMNLNRVLYDINMNIHMLCKIQFPGLNIPTTWQHIIQFFEEYKPTVICRLIKWRRPASGVFKCNTDGVAKGNPGPSSAAFCIRNDVGDLVYAVAKTLTDGTNIVAEAEAIRMGMRYCVEKQLFPLIIETDSMSMKMILKEEWKVPWSISMLVNDIKRMMEDQTVAVEHIHREGNGLADLLTNLVFDFAGTLQFHSFQELPSQAKRIMNIDKREIPNLRIRTIQDKAPD
ncbi:uncharacterized protein LOC132624080 [Lycium barbarum]|uniref:uncharacterized protein LOC132624080 n=1 Tax=Lycium barbarum TaxID=112863 RepID=UPI00293EFCE8|nr:uncharacterized protein LOC132624080 [Lycium barbarum]